MLRVMILEDNLSIREMLKSDLLSRIRSAKVIDVANGEEALKHLALYPIDLVFMDIRLQGENGLELTRKIKADYQDVTVAIVTSYDLQEYRKAAVDYGAGCFIAKSSMESRRISSMVTCFQKAKDSGRMKPGCIRIANQSAQSNTAGVLLK